MLLHTSPLLSKVFLAAALCISLSSHSLSSQSNEVSLLPENERNRIQFINQPNLAKNEVVMPKQDAMIFVVKQPLQQFIKQLTKVNNLKLTMSENVAGEMEKISLPMKLENLMSELSKTYGVEWHLQGSHLFVSNSLENTNRLIELGSLDFTKLKMALENADIISGANTITFQQEKNQVLVVGSTKYISKVQGIIKAYQSKNQSKNSQSSSVKSASN